MADEPTTQDTAPEPDATPTPDKAGPTPSKGAEFTQADVDRIVGERLKRERDKFADYSDLKKAADELAKLKEAELSETEKLQKKLAAAEEKAERAERLAHRRAISAAIISEASKLNFNIPEDAVKLLNLEQFEVDDDGQPQGVAEAVKDLADKRKYLIKSKPGGLEPFDPSKGGPVRETDEQRRRRIYGGQGLWDVDNPAQHGGGVIISKAPGDEPLTGG